MSARFCSACDAAFTPSKMALRKSSAGAPLHNVTECPPCVAIAVAQHYRCDGGPEALRRALEATGPVRDIVRESMKAALRSLGYSWFGVFGD